MTRLPADLRCLARTALREAHEMREYGGHSEADFVDLLARALDQAADRILALSRSDAAARDIERRGALLSCRVTQRVRESIRWRR